MFGANLLRIRTGLGFSQEIVANAGGVSTSSVSSWERGETLNIDAMTLAKISNFFGLLSEDLLFGTSNKPTVSSMILEQKTKIPVYEKSNIGGDVDGDKRYVGAPYNLHLKAKNQVFSFIETQDGMCPLITKKGLVYIDPDIEASADNICLFLVNGEPVLGRIKTTIIGFFLSFDNDSVEWNSVNIEKKDYLGTVIGYVPDWLNWNMLNKI